MMIPFLTGLQRRCLATFKKPRARVRKALLLLVPMTGLAMAFSSCGGDPPPRKPVVHVTDTKPVGAGLKVIGYAVLGAAVVTVLGKMVD